MRSTVIFILTIQIDEGEAACMKLMGRSEINSFFINAWNFLTSWITVSLSVIIGPWG
jgi:hypothetical protein